MRTKCQEFADSGIKVHIDSLSFVENTTLPQWETVPQYIRDQIIEYQSKFSSQFKKGTPELELIKTKITDIVFRVIPGKPPGDVGALFELDASKTLTVSIYASHIGVKETAKFGLYLASL